MVLAQTQRVHEHRGYPPLMAMNSRILLAGAAIGAVFIAVITNILQGGTSLVLVVFAGCVILAALVALLFTGKQDKTASGSTSISTGQSIVRNTGGMKDATSSVQEDLPDPLDAGFDVPLM